MSQQTEEPRTSRAGVSSGGGLRFSMGSVPVLMPWSGVFGVLLVAYLWSPSFDLDPVQGNTQIITSLIFAVLFYLSILLHEIGHAVVARMSGFPVHQIVLWVLGGYTSYERTTESSWREGLVAAAGPAVSIALGLTCALIGNTASVQNSSVQVAAVFAALAWSNTFLGIYNALPGLPLDGGAVFKSIVWGITGSERRGTVVAAWSGRVVAVSVFVIPLGLALSRGRTANLTSVIFTGFIAAYLFAGANDALKRAVINDRVPNLTALSLARRAVPVSRDLPLSEALRILSESGAGAFVLVDHEGRPVGLGHEDAVRAVPVERRPWVPVSSVSRALDASAVLSAALAGRELLDGMQAHPAAEYLVVDDQTRIVGVLATSDVEKALTG